MWMNNAHLHKDSYSHRWYWSQATGDCACGDCYRGSSIKWVVHQAQGGWFDQHPHTRQSVPRQYTEAELALNFRWAPYKSTLGVKMCMWTMWFHVFINATRCPLHCPHLHGVHLATNTYEEAEADAERAISWTSYNRTLFYYVDYINRYVRS